MRGNLGMDLPRFLGLVRARWRLLAGIVVGAFLLTFLISLTRADEYRATASLLFGRTSNADEIVGGATDTGQVPERVAATNLALASLDTVAARVRPQFRGSATVDELRQAISLKQEGQSDVVSVTATWNAPGPAAALANAFAREIVRLRRDTARGDIQAAIDSLNTTLAREEAAKAPAPTVTGLQDRIAQLEVLKSLQTGNVHLVQAATPPQHASAPTPLRNGVIAAGVALVLALFLLVLLARFDDRMDDEDAIADLVGAPVLAKIPKAPRSMVLTELWDGRADPAFLEAFEFLRLNLEAMARGDGRSMVVAVTSPVADEGKTTVAAWLARSLALSEAEVIAIDLDLRKPKLHRYLDTARRGGPAQLDGIAPMADMDAWYVLAGEPNGEQDTGREPGEPGEPGHRSRRGYGAEEITAGLVELARCGGDVRRAARTLNAHGHSMSESTLRRWTNTHADLYGQIRAAHMRGRVVGPNLRLLTASDLPELPAGLIARGRMRELLAQLRRDADFVIVDTVPVSTVADASAVAAAADGVILVVDSDRVRRRDLLAAKRQLGNARAKLLGVVLNRATPPAPGYHGPDEEPQVVHPPARQFEVP